MIIKQPTILTTGFFDRDAQVVAQDLLGKVLCHRLPGILLSAMIIETEAYYTAEKGSHAWLGFTEKRKALFMPAGTIYMYYARGGDSFNVSCAGEGNAVLFKSGIVHVSENNAPHMIHTMQQLNPIAKSQRVRTEKKLCSGQTLLCKSLSLKVPAWNQKTFDGKTLTLFDVHYTPERIIQTTRLGIPVGRDEHLAYRFIDHQYSHRCTKNPLTARKKINYTIFSPLRKQEG